jgi:predicted phage terminase large subunit-like protein
MTDLGDKAKERFFRTTQPPEVEGVKIDWSPLPHPAIRDLRGMRFGKLLVKAYSHTREQANGIPCVYWLCQCDCGNDRPVARDQLLRKGTSSCGCLTIAGNKGVLAASKTHQKRSHMTKRVRHGLPPVAPIEVIGDPANVFAYDSLMAYACLQWAGYEPAAHHHLIAKYLEKVEKGKIKRLMIFLPPRHGKECAHSTPVLTIDGWKTHGELKPGDFVFHPSGNPVEILAESSDDAYDFFDKNDDFLVKTSSGEEIRCHANHEWTVFDRFNNKWRTLETKYIFSQSIGFGEVGKRGYHYRFKLPDISPILFDQAELPLDPYFLGVWLGDGTSTNVDFVYHPKDREPRDEIERRGFFVTAEYTHKTTGVVKVSFSKQGIKNVLRDMDVFSDKNIPEIYLQSSLEQRLDLLAGIIDTDGHVERSTSRVRIATVSVKLKDSLVELLIGLGQRPYVFEQQPCVSTSGIEGRQVVYYIGFQPTIDIPTKIPRKQIDRILSGRRLVSIVSVTFEPNGEKGKCIQVDSPDGLYLVGKSLVPTHNSMIISEFFPAWYLGRNPDKRVVCASYGQELASEFGRKVRNQLADPMYGEIFPNVGLAGDSAAADKFDLSPPHRGGYFAVGAGGALTGKGANCLIIDDILKNSEEADSESHRRKLIDWYTAVAYTRLMDDGAIVLVMTRWHIMDLAGWLLKEHKHEKWTVLNLPAINEEGEALWPEKFPVPILEQIRKTLPNRHWMSLYQQKPFIEEGNIYKRQWWNLWPDTKPLPECEFIIQSWDTAYSDADRKKSSYSARVTLGVFKRVDDEFHNIILIEYWKGRVEYPELRKESLRAYQDYEPDKVIIEKKASGNSLIQDLRRAGLPLATYTPEKDKITRAYAAQSLLENGRLYYPARKWAEDFISALARFPNPDDDDVADAFSQAIIWLQSSFLVAHADDAKRRQREDAEDEDLPSNVTRFKPKKKRAAYG